jgi:uncharacterized RDD family membrane protein YckC
LIVDHVLLLCVTAPLLTVSGATLVLALPLLGLVYFTIAHGSRSGRTIGERICGIAVRSDRVHGARRATYGEAFGRALMLYLFLAGSFFGGFLNFLWPLWDAKRQAWHDKVSGTVVVHAPAFPFERRRWLRRWRRLFRR